MKKSALIIDKINDLNGVLTKVIVKIYKHIKKWHSLFK